VSARLVFDGLDELTAALRALPAALVDEATAIVDDTSARAVALMEAEYPAGELRDGVSQQTINAGPFGVGVQIKNRSGWAWHWDHGTALRHTTGGGRKAHGTGREWGATKPPHTFGRTMAQQRRRMYENLAGLLRRHGLLVSGEADGT
jgi:hypothetical protein